jgi:hypothetical protein
MTTLLIINDKLDELGSEMKIQTSALENISINTKRMAAVSLADQVARDRIYDRLAEGLLKLARVISWVMTVGFFLVFVLVIAAVYKQDLNLEIGGNKIEMGKTIK